MNALIRLCVPPVAQPQEVSQPLAGRATARPWWMSPRHLSPRLTQWPSSRRPLCGPCQSCLRLYTCIRYLSDLNLDRNTGQCQNSSFKHDTNASFHRMYVTFPIDILSTAHIRQPRLVGYTQYHYTCNRL